MKTKMNMVWASLTLITAVSVCALTDSQFNVLVKQLEHTAVVQGKPVTAAEQCLATLNKEELTEKQSGRLQELLKKTALASNNNNLIRKVVDYCTERDIPCSALQQKLGFAPPETSNPRAEEIREALEYLWNTLNWQESYDDYETFDSYLETLAFRTNISEVARIQAVLFRSILGMYRQDETYKDTVLLQYERLLHDINRTDHGYTIEAVYDAMNRLYSTAQECISAGQPLMARMVMHILSRYADYIAHYTDVTDLFSIQSKRLSTYFNKQKLSPAEQLEPAMKLYFKGLAHQTWETDFLRFDRIHEYSINTSLSAGLKETPEPRAALSVYCRYDIKPGGTGFRFVPRDRRRQPISFIVNTNSLHALLYAIKTNDYIMNNIVGDKTNEIYVLSQMHFNPDVLIWHFSNNLYYCETTITACWNKAVWNERFSAFSNRIWQVAESLNEIRKYVLSQKKETDRTAPETQRTRDELWPEFTNNWMTFVKQGPTNGTQALPALDKAIEVCGIFHPQLQQQLQNLKNFYTTDFGAGCKYILNQRHQNLHLSHADVARWHAAYVLPKIHKLEAMLEKTSDPVLQKQFTSGFYNQYRGAFSTLEAELSPAVRLFEYIIHRQQQLEPSTVQPLLTIISNRLQEMLDHDQSYISPIHYAELLGRCLPVFAEYPEFSRMVLHNPSLTRDNWQLEARIVAAQSHLRSIEKLDEREQVYQTIRTLTDLICGIFEDAGVSTNNLHLFNVESALPQPGTYILQE